MEKGARAVAVGAGPRAHLKRATRGACPAPCPDPPGGRGAGPVRLRSDMARHPPERTGTGACPYGLSPLSWHLFSTQSDLED